MATHPQDTRPAPQVLDPPLRLVFWELTARCNLRCRHCRRLETPGTEGEDAFSPEAGLRFVDQVAECGGPILVISGGEPLLRPDLFALAERAAARGLAVSLATNGTLIDAELAARIAAARIRRVAISIDGADAKTHDRFRGIEGALDAALIGCRLLRARGVPWQLNCTVTNRNLHQRDELYELARREGAEALHLFVLVPVGCGLEIKDSHRLSAEQVEGLLNWLADRSVSGPLHVKATCAPQYFRIRLQRGLGPGGPPGGDGALNAATRGCLAGSGVCFVSHRGDCFPCGYLPIKAGNVLAQPLRKIWTTSSVLGIFRHTLNLEGKCGGCGYKDVCLGCRARAFALTGNALAEDPYCAYEP